MFLNSPLNTTNMEFYDAKHPGDIIKDPKEQTLIRKDGTFQGFFPANKLKEFLKKKNPVCVGIRFYNAGGLKEERRLVAVGVTADGSELNPSTNLRYMASATALLPMEPMSRDQATHAVWEAKALRKKEPDKARITFASFFSAEMIKKLLEPKGTLKIEGISFYIVQRNIEGAGIVNTHLGVSSILDKGNSKPVENIPSDSPSYIVSDLPCPKYCIAPVRVNDTIKFALADQPILTNPKYLVVWDK